MIDPIADVQSSRDSRNIPIDQVGIKNLRFPIRVSGGGTEQATVAQVSMTVALPAEQKGTHMSRFVALMEEYTEAFCSSSLPGFTRAMLEKLDAQSGRIELCFPYFLQKSAPVSGIRSMMDYQVTLTGEISDGTYRGSLQAVVPVTSLCPCSKQISDYGAHNQRSHLTVAVECAPGAVDIGELIRLAEEQASCQLYGLLKRPDEKYVTEYAYDHPKFVEDLVRDTAAALAADPHITGFTVESENFESIHNHSAYARISRP